MLKIDKKALPQAYLEHCKYKLKKIEGSRYIDHLEITDYDSENDSDGDSIGYFEIKSKEEIENLITS